MPQLVVLGLLGAGLYLGYRWISRQSARVAEDLRRAEEALRARETARMGPAEVASLPKLEQDAETGVYRPARSQL